ncbi:ERCC4 domain-containing protein [Bombardia bombarda]|uniref:ERCC4 domain-containing protein n=1 Tax=Bombardia bombarda TaxID=252184 RepID=A0AA39XIG6_9PEZI|nr:ERCC4 domain-containing protein [Bombardia bombarda]
MPRSFSEVITLDDSDSDDEFPDISTVDPTKLVKTASARNAPARPAPRPPAQRPQPKQPALRKTDDEKAKEKEEKAAAREAELERKRLEKERAKQERALEKERAAALAEVNKIRTDKKVSTPEMIVDFPATINHAIKLQAESLLKDLDVQCATWTSPVDNVVRWRRKVKSRYNEELGHWEPVPMCIEPDNHVMVLLPAAEFVKLVLAGDSGTLEAHVGRMQTHFPNNTIIYLIEGLTPWLRKNRNLRNRQFVSAVRSGLDEDSATASSADAPPPSGTIPPQTYIDEDTIEDALLQLQVLHGVLIHHTTAAVETAQWVAVFTQHISTVPYRRQREDSNAAAAGFCMETGQVRTGDGARDTYVRMLQEIGRVTAPIAYGIAAEFETVSQLVRGLEAEGPLRLEGVRKSANKDGAVSDRAVGQAVSRRIHKIFTGRDETSTDV